jgi:hypothetical protein
MIRMMMMMMMIDDDDVGIDNDIDDKCIAFL